MRTKERPRWERKRIPTTRGLAISGWIEKGIAKKRHKIVFGKGKKRPPARTRRRGGIPSKRTGGI